MAAKSVDAMRREWEQERRWKGVERPYRPEDVERLRGSVHVEHTLARMGAERLWKLLHEESPVLALGALTGNQAIEQVQAGLKAVYLSGWQVAGDANTALQVYPDQSLYPVDSGPTAVRRLNAALMRADQIWHMEGRRDVHWLAPIIADAEAGFGGNLNTFELVKAFIEAGAAAIHLEDQLSSLKKCGHMGGKVLVSTGEAIQKLVSARLAADVMGVPTLVIARTDALAARLLRNDVDERDRAFMGQRTDSVEGFFDFEGGIDAAISRAVSYAPFADLLWCETSTPDIDEARRFAEGVRSRYPGKLLAYNCSPSFNWSRTLDAASIARFNRELGAMGYAFQFITLAGFHTLNASMFELAHGFARQGMPAFVKLQDKEFDMAKTMGFTAVKHQRFVGAGYFDEVSTVLSGGDDSTTALRGSTEEAQFEGVGTPERPGVH